jgi:uncharacterized protein with ParB-like and HNH nuclease domain
MPFRLFETLNDRGLELSVVELMKNFILMQLTSKDANLQTIDQTIQNWNELYQKIRYDMFVKFLRFSGMSVKEAKLYKYPKQRYFNSMETTLFPWLSL